MPSNPIGFDASTSLSHYVGGFKAANVAFVGRYIASESDQQWKVITPAEAVELAIAEVPLFPIYENTAKQTGAATGHADGTYAASYLPKIGLMPNAGVIIYYCEDYNVPPGDMPGVAAAFTSFGAALTGYQIGVYSCGDCNTSLKAQGLVVRKWLSGSTSYHGTQHAIDTGDYDMRQGLPVNITINGRIINVDIDTVRPAGADIGARVPWDGKIPRNATLSVVAIQMLLNRAGQNPPLAPDDVTGNLTRAAIIASKHKYG